MRRIYFLVTLIIIFGSIWMSAANSFQSNKKITLILDAGHGGRDTGARGLNGANEKSVVLAITKKLAQAYGKNNRINIILTRNGDYYVPLYQRLMTARKYNADLFISIHADAANDPDAKGASVYRLSNRGASTVMAKWLANRENHEDLGDIRLDALKDRSSMLRSVLIDLALTKTSENSLRLGNSVLGNLKSITKLHYKRVERAPFLVLKSPDIPSVLIETGFISNPYEERRLQDARYQTQLVTALKQGIDAYVKKYYR